MELATISLGQTMHVLWPHLLIGFRLVNSCSTFGVTVGKWSDLGGLELLRGRFGSFLTILLLTSMFAILL